MHAAKHSHALKYFIIIIVIIYWQNQRTLETITLINLNSIN